jgi:hypothetical protein
VQLHKSVRFSYFVDKLGSLSTRLFCVNNIRYNFNCLVSSGYSERLAPLLVSYVFTTYTLSYAISGILHLQAVDLWISLL